MSVPFWLIVTLYTVAVDVRLGLLLVRLNVKIPRCWIVPTAAVFKYSLLSPPPPESRDQATSPVGEVVQVNITVSPGHTGVYEGEL